MGRGLLVLSVFMLTFVTFSRGESQKEKLPFNVAFEKDVSYIKGRLLVRRQHGVKIQEMASIHAAIGAKVAKKFAHPQGLELITLPQGVSILAAMQFYKNNPNVLYAEPDYYVHSQATPNDAKWSEQWAQHNTGQTSGTSDADVNAPEMWDLTTGDADVVLGVIDTGILHSHPDLTANVWVNVNEIDGNQIDDDGNGYVDDMHGINVITKKGDPRDDNGHGTHVAGIMGAAGNNGEGVSGINQKVSIVGCKFLDAFGGGSTSDAIACMDYMLKLKIRATHPVNIVATNNSWAGGGFSQAMLDAIKAHKEAGILFIAAASNDGLNNDLVETYPANYPASNILSVAASDRNDGMASFSNYGTHSVHIAAPGVDILSTFLGNSYDELSGTSMAAPQVTGMAGLIKAFDPALDWKSIKNLIVAGGQHKSAFANNTISGRRLRGAGNNGEGSLTCRDQIVRKVLSPKSESIAISLGQSIDFSVLHINCANPNGAPILISDVDDLDLTDDGQGNDDEAGDGIYSARFTPDQGGHYDFDLGDGHIIDVSVYDTSSWKPYRVLTPTSFSYRTIAGSKLSMTDDSVASVVSPFPIAFAGDENGLTTLYIGSNGTISFTENTVSSWQNETLPFAGFQTLVAPFWDDLNPTRQGGVYYEVIGTAPNRELVVEWRRVPQYTAGDPLTFEVVFFENSSDILFNYADVTLGNSQYDGGASATVGIQVGSSAATQQGFNQAILTDNSALLFTQH